MQVIINGTRGELLDILEDAKEIGSESWRHGRRLVLVFEYQGQHLRTTVDLHPEEGWQIYGAIVGTVVRPVQRTVTVWEEVRDD